MGGSGREILRGDGPQLLTAGNRNNMCNLQKWRLDDASKEQEDGGRLADSTSRKRHLSFLNIVQTAQGPPSFLSGVYHQRDSRNKTVGV